MKLEMQHENQHVSLYYIAINTQFIIVCVPCINNSSNLMDVIYKMYLEQILSNIIGGKRTHNNPLKDQWAEEIPTVVQLKIIVIPIKSNVN